MTDFSSLERQIIAVSCHLAEPGHDLLVRLAASARGEADLRHAAQKRQYDIDIAVYMQQLERYEAIPEKVRNNEDDPVLPPVEPVAPVLQTDAEACREKVVAMLGGIMIDYQEGQHDPAWQERAINVIREAISDGMISNVQVAA